MTGRAQGVVFVLMLVLTIAGEVWRWSDPDKRAVALADWLCGMSADWLPFLPWLLAAAAAWGIRRRPNSASREAQQRTQAATLPLWGLAMMTAAISFGVSAWTGVRFGDLPPAYHDEFSYVFQAKTFLAGRLSFPSFEPQPELFDQMHVLNEGRFASRYFPGTGLWLAPFVAIGQPYLGHWLAGALATVCVFWIGWEIGGRRTAIVAGLLNAVSPGLALFSNLLLAHHPTLLGLTFFAWMYLRAQRTGRFRDHALGAVGLTFAMLCRPMSAFGVGLPFGALLAWQLLRPTAGNGDPSDPRQSDPSPIRRRALIVVAWGAPIAWGLGGMLFFNAAITGDAWVSPYQLYTDTYTPRHVYGFHNVTRGEQRLGPKVLENYDVWAEELTPSLAARNVGRRFIASSRWTIGIVPVVGAALVLLMSASTRNRGVLLVAAAIASLHAVHVPYWFEGIMGWHYVFESAPLWVLLVAEATRRMFAAWEQSGRTLMRWWWSGALLTGVAVNLATVPALWPGRLPTGISEVAFSRQRYAAFFAAARELAAGRPTIVFVESDPADRHIDYVVNDPALDGPLLFARYRPDRMHLDKVRALFPDRQAFLFKAATREWQRLP